MVRKSRFYRVGPRFEQAEIPTFKRLIDTTELSKLS